MLGDPCLLASFTRESISQPEADRLELWPSIVSGTNINIHWRLYLKKVDCLWNAIMIYSEETKLSDWTPMWKLSKSIRSVVMILQHIEVSIFQENQHIEVGTIKIVHLSICQGLLLQCLLPQSEWFEMNYQAVLLINGGGSEKKKKSCLLKQGTFQWPNKASSHSISMPILHERNLTVVSNTLTLVACWCFHQNLDP